MANVRHCPARNETRLVDEEDGERDSSSGPWNERWKKRRESERHGRKERETRVAPRGDEERSWEPGGQRGREEERKKITEPETPGREKERVAASLPFSPFTYTLAAGNGIANPTTLHASWQLVISHPVLRQHTSPRSVLPPPCLRLRATPRHPD